MAFKRVLLKLSGEALMGPRDYGLDELTSTRSRRSSSRFARAVSSSGS